RRIHATGSRRTTSLVHKGSLPGRSRSGATGAGAFGCATRDLPRILTRWNAGCFPGWAGIRRPVISHGARDLGCLCPLWWLALDAACLLRNRRRRGGDHRTLGVEAGEDGPRTRLAEMGDLFRARDLYCSHRPRTRLAILAWGHRRVRRKGGHDPDSTATIGNAYRVVRRRVCSARQGRRVALV